MVADNAAREARAMDRLERGRTQVTRLVWPKLVNGPFADPGLFIDIGFGRRALLFDLGDLGPLSSRELLRVSHAFVSHAHMDHFAGFDRLLRVMLHRAGTLHLVGPSGFADRVAAKLGAYTWNLLDGSSIDFSIVVDEFDHRIGGRWRFRAREAFRRRDEDAPSLAAGLVLDEPDFAIEAAVLDHGLPCLAFALQERLSVNVARDALVRRGLPVGPWLNAAKRAVRRGDPDDAMVAVDGGGAIALGELKREILRVAQGQRVAYVVDAAPHEDNIARAADLARGADQLFIETAFADDDAAIAAARHHLTTGAAAEIARRAGARQVVPFHFSARYLDRPELIPGEVARALHAG
jgi:ribonuclease Z